MSLKGAAHERIESVLLAVQDHRQGNVNRRCSLPPKMDLVGIGNVVDDEIAGVEFTVRVVLALVFVVRIARQNRCANGRKNGQNEEGQTLFHV